MTTVSKQLYDRLIENRPFKLSAEEVDYRIEKEGEERCENCVHFYTRKVDGHNTCEIYRPVDDESIDPDYVCSFYSANGEDFPLLTPIGMTSEDEQD